MSIGKDPRKVFYKPIFKVNMFFRAFLDSEIHLEVKKNPGVLEILGNKNGQSLVRDEQVKIVRILEKHVGDCLH